MHTEDLAKLTAAITSLTAAVLCLNETWERTRTELQGANTNLGDRYQLGPEAPDDATTVPGHERKKVQPLLGIRCRNCNGTLARIEGDEVVLTIECPVCGARYQPDPTQFIDVKHS